MEAKATLPWCAAICAKDAGLHPRPLSPSQRRTDIAPLLTPRAGARAYTLHGRDVFAADCNCREILDHSMRMIAEEGCGVILYLHNVAGFELDRTPAPAEASSLPVPRLSRFLKTPAASSCTRNCARAKGRRHGLGAFSAPSAWVPDSFGSRHSTDTPALEHPMHIPLSKASA